MKIGSRLADASVKHYKLVTLVMVVAGLLMGLVATLPTLLPDALGFLHTIEVDTDPENMLSADEPVRVFHDRMKERMDLHDIVVVGVVNEEDPAGVFNPGSLAKVHELTEFAGQLNGASEVGRAAGLEEGERVIAADIIAPSTVDNIIPAGDAVRFEWLMPTPPETQEEADEVLANARRIPFFEGTMVPPEDDQAVMIYLPISSKDISYKVYRALNEKVAALGGPERYYITGLPVAEDTFGVEMFKQMAISAPTAMVIIFVLMLLFFRKLVIIVSPLIVALVSVIFTMGALVVCGFPIHIMSSMIPIFIMPIAVLDSVHILSEFFEKYQATRDARRTAVAVMDELFAPMLYTSLTSAAGFASLALTPIPPVQVFGVFVAVGILVAWLLTVMFIPAFVMFIPARMLENFGAKHTTGEQEHHTALARFMRWVGGATYRRAKPILAVAAVVLVIAGWGISRIRINDNPIKWFTPEHPIREADRVLNQHFGGTYMAYLAVEYDEPEYAPTAYAEALARRAERRAAGGGEFLERLDDAARQAADEVDSLDAFFTALKDRLRPAPDDADDEALSVWKAVEDFLDREWDRLLFADPPVEFDRRRTPALLADRADAFAAGLHQAAEETARQAERVAEHGPATREAFRERLVETLAAGRGEAAADDVPLRSARAAMEFLVQEEAQRFEVFKRPEVLAHLKELGEVLATARNTQGRTVVGKSNSLVEIVETVNRDLHDGRPEHQRIPNTQKAVGSAITQFQSSHRPQDLAHFVTPWDYQTASMWVQLTSGDNRDMSAVVRSVEDHLAANPPPVPLRHRWFGLTYINVIWQDKMVRGMLQAFAGSFLVVFLLMTLLFRSGLWGLLSMVPLTVTIAAIYGAIGIVGKDYDMPVAVLSSLTLGLAVDFAIHFLARARVMYAESGSWRETAPRVFGEPARAIARNVIVIAAGFLPLLLAPLMPYRTVGMLLATILLVSGVATLFLLPAMIRLLERVSGRVTRVLLAGGAGVFALVGLGLLADAIAGLAAGARGPVASVFELIGGAVGLVMAFVLVRGARRAGEFGLFATSEAIGPTCHCATCLLSGMAMVGLVAVNVYRYLQVGFNVLVPVSIVLVAALAGGCALLSGREKCTVPQPSEEAPHEA